MKTETCKQADKGQRGKVCLWEIQVLNRVSGQHSMNKPLQFSLKRELFLDWWLIVLLMDISHLISDTHHSIVCFVLHSHLQRHWSRHMTRTFRWASLLFYFAFSTHTLCENTAADLSSRESSPLMKLYSVIGWGCHSFQWWFLDIVPGNHTWPDCQHCERLHYHLFWWGNLMLSWVLESQVCLKQMLDRSAWWSPVSGHLCFMNMPMQNSAPEC